MFSFNDQLHPAWRRTRQEPARLPACLRGVVEIKEELDGEIFTFWIMIEYEGIS